MTRPTLETQNCAEVDQMHGIGRHDPMVSPVGVSAVDPSSPESVSDPRDRVSSLRGTFLLDFLTAFLDFPGFLTGEGTAVASVLLIDEGSDSH
jgi:hypothetical protein